MQEYKSDDYVIQVHDSWQWIDEGAWNALLAQQKTPTLFMQHAYLKAMEESQAAIPDTGWGLQIVTLWQEHTNGLRLCSAAPLYLKGHSYGEYVFDWAWADAYQRNGLRYYPKGLVAVPFTPVPGPRLLAIDASARAALVQALLQHMHQEDLSSLHLLFVSDEDAQACRDAGMALRTTVQFHWHNRQPQPYADFDDFLGQLQQEKRKKIRQERRKVSEAGVRFRHIQGADMGVEDWAFFLRCYQQTYFEHGNAPYLSRDFFQRMQDTMPENWVLFIAEKEGQRMACSLIAVQDNVAYGRYWGALERVDCLHFEACYYQPIAWCIAKGLARFEGGAQGEHKMARALLPVKASSAHWLAHPDFADAVERYLEKEGRGVAAYLENLEARSPLKKA